MRNRKREEEEEEGGLPGGGSPSSHFSLGKTGVPGRGRKASKHRSGNRLRKWKKSVYGVLGAGVGAREMLVWTSAAMSVCVRIQKSF